MAPLGPALFIPLLVLAGCTAQDPSNASVAGAGPGLSCRAATEPARLLRCATQQSHANERDQALACLPHSPPVHLRGVWVIVLEGSTFFEGAARYKPEMSQSIGTWLEPDHWSPEQTRSAQGERVRAYLVDFVGRRSLCRFGYGHMGVSPDEVVVDQFTSIREIY